ncbi:MAG TPA: hypothetical protein VNC78_08085 [Actinomycetota bacterium]|nr:hypothetical protein [Actinomycetota bacterium]
MIPTVIAQKVQSVSAHRSYHALIRRFGERAPGPAPLMLPPEPAALCRMPYHLFHPLGLEKRRADILRGACSYARRLEETLALAGPDGSARFDDAKKLYTAIPGIGPWTAAIVSEVALGDPDAVPVGDYNVPNLVSWVLAGEPRGDDARMLELLEPYRGHRGRAIRLLEAGGSHPPSYGPRHPIRRIAKI